MGMIERKKAILLNEPHISTASGTIVNFKTDMTAPLKECKITFQPKQSGTGDPSPTNVRPISGYTELTLTHTDGNNNGTESTITFPSSAGTIYGGYVDLVSGEIVQTHAYKHVTSSDMQGTSTGSSTGSPTRAYTYRISGAKSLTASTFANSIVSDKIKAESVGTYYPVLYEGLINDSGRFMFGVPEEISTIDTVKSWVDSIGGIDVIYELDTPIIYQLTPQTLKSLKGTNNIYTNANGTVEVKYWTH